jgi:threonine synthase
VKCEHLNPTGSFKDRGTFLLASILVHAGISEVVEDSSGNAGASLAAYAAKAGIRAQIFVPAYSSGPKRLQIEAYGAEVVSVPGPRTATTEAVLRVVEEGANYASHAYQPHGMAGMMTVAFEIVEQLGRSPGSVILPVGQGSLFLGLARGFWAMVEAGEIENMPQMIAVQARACAPLWAVHQFGAAGRLWMREGETAAEGIRILHPLRGDRVLDAIERSGGTIVAVQEEEIEDGWGALSRRGFFVEPTSAVVWPALLSTGEELSDPIVMVLTGSGFKSVDGLRREART